MGLRVGLYVVVLTVVGRLVVVVVVVVLVLVVAIGTCFIGLAHGLVCETAEICDDESAFPNGLAIECTLSGDSYGRFVVVCEGQAQVS